METKSESETKSKGGTFTFLLWTAVVGGVLFGYGILLLGYYNLSSKYTQLEDRYRLLDDSFKNISNENAVLKNSDQKLDICFLDADLKARLYIEACGKTKGCIITKTDVNNVASEARKEKELCLQRYK